MTTAEAILVGLICHGLGDYVIQSDWMAHEKTHRWWPAIVHAVTYGLPFLVVTQSPAALALIIGTHAVIDRYRLARHVIWAKNFVSPRRYRFAWAECVATGYHKERPPWMAVWLMIAADNTIHVAINTATLWWLR